MLWIYGQYKCFNSFSDWIDFIRLNLTSTDSDSDVQRRTTHCNQRKTAYCVMYMKLNLTLFSEVCLFWGEPSRARVWFSTSEFHRRGFYICDVFVSPWLLSLTARMSEISPYSEKIKSLCCYLLLLFAPLEVASHNKVVENWLHCNFYTSAKFVSLFKSHRYITNVG